MIQALREDTSCRAEMSHTFTDAEVRHFSDLSSDFNPIHLNEEFAQSTVFKTRIVHGMFVASKFSGLLGSQWPGEGTIYLGQNLSFKAPVKLGQSIRFIVELKEFRQDKPIATLTTRAYLPDGTVAIEGDATVKLPEVIWRSLQTAKPS